MVLEIFQAESVALLQIREMEVQDNQVENKEVLERVVYLERNFM